MRKTYRFGAAVAAAAAVSVLFGAISPVSSQPPRERVDIVLFEPNRGPGGFEKELNLGGKGFGSGDMFLLKARQLDPESCDRAGTLWGRIQIIKRAGRENAVFTGDFTLNLPDGKILAGGVARFSDFESEEPIFAVTGGTEAYRDASGEVVLEEGVRQCDRRGGLTTVSLLLER